MLEAKGFAKPDDTREFGHGKLEIIKIGSGTVGKSTFEPGWKWSNDVKPIAKTPIPARSTTSATSSRVA